VDELEQGLATRTDSEGVRQEVGFFGPFHDKLFGSLHRPQREAHAGVVICPAIHSDFERNYRRDVLLARALSARGYAVQRFHYRGLGNSDGDISDATFETMRDDASVAAEQLQSATGVSSVAFAGTRWGAFIAAAAAAGFDGAPLCLWEPPVNGARYFAEASRARLVREAKEDGSASPSGSSLQDEIRRSGRADILGYPIDTALFDSAVGRSIDGELGNAPRPILLVQMGTKRGLRTVYKELTDLWTRRGFQVEVRAIEGEETWWFVGGFWEAVESRDSTKQILEVTASWLMSSMAPAPAR
jgi:alpha/beta superfamily hydrolase